MGVFLDEFKLVFAKSNNIEFNLNKMFELLSDDSYPENLIVNNDVQDLIEFPKGKHKAKLFSFKSVKSLICQVFTSDTRDYADLMNCFPDINVVYKFYQVIEHKWIKVLRNIIVKKVKTNTKMNVSYFIFEKEFKTNYEPDCGWKMLANPNFMIEQKYSDILENTWFETVKNEQTFQIRFLSKEVIDLERIIKEPDLVNEGLRQQFKKVIIHIHGGGFITMSSSSHLSYLSKFVRKCDAVLFTIDYPLAPQFKYKTIIDCIFKAYMLIIVG